MNEQTIYKILSVVTEKSEEALMAFSKDQSLLDLGLDSIKFIQFIVAVEEAFQIEIRDSDLLFSKFETIEKLFSTLSGYLESTPLKKVLVCEDVYKRQTWHFALPANFSHNLNLVRFILCVFKKIIIPFTP